MKTKTTTWFTLIELLVVIAIIGILAITHSALARAKAPSAQCYLSQQPEAGIARVHASLGSLSEIGWFGNAYEELVDTKM